MDSGVHFKSSIVHSIISADVAQSVVHLICNQKVASSRLVISSIKIMLDIIYKVWYNVIKLRVGSEVVKRRGL